MFLRQGHLAKLGVRIGGGRQMQIVEKQHSQPGGDGCVANHFYLLSEPDSEPDPVPVPELVVVRPWPSPDP